MNKCLAITPARDEERFLPGLIESMAAQTCRPQSWIVIDDGSADQTAALLGQAALEHPWIEVHHLPRNRARAFGGESVIMHFLKPERIRGYDYILRLDADLTFGPTMIESLLTEFSKDQDLGVGGAVLYEPHNGAWHEVKVPRFHTRGAVKMYSTRCFEAIGGLHPGVGWDTIDEAHAMLLGFTAKNFPSIVANHHRPQGLAGGLLRSRFSTGHTAYLVGYSPVFMMMRSLVRLFDKPIFVGSLMMLSGYLSGYLRASQRVLPRS